MPIVKCSNCGGYYSETHGHDCPRTHNTNPSIRPNITSTNDTPLATTPCDCGHLHLDPCNPRSVAGPTPLLSRSHEPNAHTTATDGFSINLGIRGTFRPSDAPTRTTANHQHRPHKETTYKPPILHRDRHHPDLPRMPGYRILQRSADPEADYIERHRLFPELPDRMRTAQSISGLVSSR